jgi:hypothetical protein
LRWINAGSIEWVQTITMDRFSKPQTGPRQRPDTAGAMAAMAERLALATVPAAWPTGVSQLAQAVDACQRCEPGQVGMDWLTHGDYLTT